MKIGGKYNWIGQPDRLIYLGKKGHWHQFSKIGDPRPVWCEVLTKDLYMIRETLTTKEVLEKVDAFLNRVRLWREGEEGKGEPDLHDIKTAVRAALQQEA